VGDRLRAFLSIRDGEGRLVSWLVLHAVLGGIPLTLTTAAANALFLQHHEASQLPYAYLASALVVPAVGWACLRLERRARFDHFLQIVVLVVACGDIAARLAIGLLGHARGTWALPVWTEVEYGLTSLELYALAGRLLDVQQAKRLFGVIGSGALLSGGLAGLSSPLLIRFAGTENLLLLSATASLASLLVLRRISRHERERLGVEEHDEERDDPKHRAPRELRPYFRAIYALVALGFVTYYVTERVFYEGADATIPDTAALAAFLGIFLGVIDLVSLVFRAWLSSRILSRFGLTIALFACPFVVSAGALTATGAGLALGVASAGAFWAVIATRAASGALRESLDHQATLMLFQPLPRADRVAVRATAEGIVGPLAGGCAAAGLILLERVGTDVTRLCALLAAAGIAWLLVAGYLGRAYKKVLERALADRRVERDELVVGESARASLLRSIDSPWPGEVLYALDMLEEVERTTRRRNREEHRHERLLEKLLAHGSPYVRREVLRRIESGALTSLAPRVREMSTSDPDARVRGRAFRVLAAICDDDEADAIFASVADAEPRIRREVMTGCLASGSMERIAIAWGELRRMAESPDAKSRIFAADVIRKIANPTFHRPLLKLLADDDLEVRRAALVACKTVRHPRLLPLVVGSLRLTAVRARAAATLSAIGEPALAPLRELANEDDDWRVRVRALRIAARVRGRAAERLALDLVDTPAEEVRQAALQALVACGHRSTDSALFESIVRREQIEAASTLAAIVDLGGLSLVASALRRELAGSRERILLALSFVHDAAPIHAARVSYTSISSDRRAIALELLESALPKARRDTIVPLFDDIAPKDALDAIPEEVLSGEADGQSRRERLRDLLDPRRTTVTSWTRVCALWTLRDREAARKLENAADEDVRETARRLLANGAARSKGASMLTVEKVLILRAVPMFQRTPDHILADVARILKEVALQANAELIKEGDFGDCMFVIVSGAVRVHQGDETIATLGPRDIVGELSVLAPGPRSASVTTTEPTQLLRIDRNDFYDMMADRIEIVQGILSVLCDRVRGTTSHSQSLLPSLNAPMTPVSAVP
jgi:HEAT repeat protein